MNFFELILAFAAIVALIYSLLILLFRNNTTMLRAMLVPEIFLEDVGETNTFRMGNPKNRAIGIQESAERRKSIRLKRHFSVYFGLLMLGAALSLLYFSVY